MFNLKQALRRFTPLFSLVSPRKQHKNLQTTSMQQVSCILDEEDCRPTTPLCNAESRAHAPAASQQANSKTHNQTRCTTTCHQRSASAEDQTQAQAQTPAASASLNVASGQVESATHNQASSSPKTTAAATASSPSEILKPHIRANRFAFWIPGFALASWTPLIPYVKNNFDLGTELLGLLLMCLAAGQALAVIVSPMIINFLGCKRTVKLMGLGLVLGLLSITLVSNLYLLGLLLLTYGWMVETVSMSANLNAVRLEKQVKRSLLSGMHGILSLGSVTGVMLVTAMLHLDLPVSIPVICTAEILSMLVLLYCSQIASGKLLSKKQMASPTLGISALEACNVAAPSKAKSQAKAQPQAQAKTKSSTLNELKRVLTQPVLWGLGVMCLVIYVTEDSVNDWSGLYLIQDYGLPIQEAGLGYLAFASMMALSRLIGDRLVWSFGRKQVIFGGAVLTALGFVLATSGISAVVSLVGFGLVGLGTANIAPQCISYAASLKSLPQSSIFVVNGVGAIGSLVGPAVIGQITSWLSLHTTFLLIALALAGVAILSLIMVKEHQTKQAKQQAYVRQSVEGFTLPCNFHHKYISTYRAAQLENQAQVQGLLHPRTSFRQLKLALSDFITLENPMLFWQNLSLQHWTISSLEEPPGSR